MTDRLVRDALGFYTQVSDEEPEDEEPEEPEDIFAEVILSTRKGRPRKCPSPSPKS